MKGILIKNFKFIPPKGFSALAFFPFLFVNTKIYKWKDQKKREILLNHEGIHFYQQMETILILFYVIYSIEFCINVIRYRDPIKAYRNISFEREAYDNEKKLNYIDNRKPFSWIKYIFQK